MLLTSYPANQILLERLKKSALFSPCRFCLPACCQTKDFENPNEILFYPAENSIIQGLQTRGAVMVLSNAAVLTVIDPKRLREILFSLDCDIVNVRVDPALEAGCEQVVQAQTQHIVGFRRHYQPAAEPDWASGQWPDFLVSRTKVGQDTLLSLLQNPASSFLGHWEQKDRRMAWLRVGGQRLDLFSDAGLKELLQFSQTLRPRMRQDRQAWKIKTDVKGTVHFGRNVQLGPNCVIAAPAILCDHAEVGEGTVLHEVLLGPSVRVAPKQRIQRQVIWNGQKEPVLSRSLPVRYSGGLERPIPFRQWSLFSYPRFWKRFVDILISLLVLLLFLPFFPFIALAVKLTSSGPIFYRARRQGLHGKEFHCLKFRTMILGAESLQENLRTVNQVDGPQFKMEDDPRTSPIGKFLRDTCIDELPQFFNVLLGQMSVVGPRPSPEQENEFCPVWRDARLSVRPGITGLWQVSRTRQAGRDFQEWIYYDMEYVRHLSLRLDLLICFRTARKLIVSFLDQFG